MKFIVTFYDKDNNEIKGSIFDDMDTEWESKEEIETAIGIELTVDYILAEVMRYTVEEVNKTNNQWYPYENLGAYYRLEDGVLMACAMERGGSREDSPVEVTSWEHDDVGTGITMEDLIKELEGKE